MSIHPLIFGEVLYDIFEAEHKKILGGAPFNVAWHLQGFGLKPLMISRVGLDKEGFEIQEIMQNWGLSTTLLQQDAQHPTGQVRIQLQAGMPHFEIPAAQAYDYIEFQPLLNSLSNNQIPLLYQGTLALRNVTSRATLEILLELLNCPIFLDINLRAPWWEKTKLENQIHQATWLKVNEVELEIIALQFKTASSSKKEELLEEICQFYQLNILIITFGDQGAWLKKPQQPVLKETAPMIKVIDTVGAGDAFSAVCILGLLQNWPHEVLLKRALNFAALICQIQGAIPTDRNFYSQAQANWTLDCKV